MTGHYITTEHSCQSSINSNTKHRGQTAELLPPSPYQALIRPLRSVRTQIAAYARTTRFSISRCWRASLGVLPRGGFSRTLILIEKLSWTRTAKKRQRQCWTAYKNSRSSSEKIRARHSWPLTRTALRIRCLLPGKPTPPVLQSSKSTNLPTRAGSEMSTIPLTSTNLHGGCFCRAIRYQIVIPQAASRPLVPGALTLSDPYNTAATTREANDSNTVNTTSVLQPRCPQFELDHCQSCRRACGSIVQAWISRPSPGSHSHSHQS